MGSTTTVYGFIALDPGFREENGSVFTHYSFDETYPFTNIFGSEVAGYESSVISFGGTFKSLLEDWDEWEVKFDRLLSLLYCRSATVRVNDEIEGDMAIEYVCSDGWNPAIALLHRRWTKWRTNSEGIQSEETQLRLG